MLRFLYKYKHTEEAVWFTWLTKIEFVSAFPGKLGAVTSFLLVSVLQMELQKCSLPICRQKGCRDLNAQNLEIRFLICGERG